MRLVDCTAYLTDTERDDLFAATLLCLQFLFEARISPHQAIAQILCDMTLVAFNGWAAGGAAVAFTFISVTAFNSFLW